MPADDTTTPRPDPSGAPVFVDATGRRARRIERLAALIVLGCLGYGLALLIAALTGVPIEGAVVPYPAIGSHPHIDRPAGTPTGQPTTSATTGPGGLPSASATPSAVSASLTTHPTTTRSSRPTASATKHPTSRPTTTATATHGKSTSAPGATHRPTTVPSPTTHGRTLHP